MNRRDGSLSVEPKSASVSRMSSAVPVRKRRGRDQVQKGREGLRNGLAKPTWGWGLRGERGVELGTAQFVCR